MENQSIMVVASKYLLEVKIAGKTAYKKDGQKTELHGPKMLTREWVEMRNSQENNELYIIDEEATEVAMAQREENIILNAARDKKSKMSMADLIDAVATKSEKPKKTSKKSSKKEEVEEEVETPVDETMDELEEYSVEELQHYCTTHGIKFHHKAGKEKLIELIKQ